MVFGRPDGPDSVSDTVLAAFAEFSEALARDERPEVEEFLLRYPRLAGKLRPALEAAARYEEKVRDFEQRFPGFSVWDVFRQAQREDEEAEATKARKTRSRPTS